MIFLNIKRLMFSLLFYDFSKSERLNLLLSSVNWIKSLYLYKVFIKFERLSLTRGFLREREFCSKAFSIWIRYLLVIVYRALLLLLNSL